MGGLNTAEEHFNTCPPRVLYHYTTKDAFEKILASKEIWASKVQHLNDQQEIRLAIELASQNLEELARHNRSMPSIQRELEEMILDIEGYESVNIFAASFTECADSVSQFEHYGDYALGFRSECLARLNSWRFHLAQCVYDAERQTELVRYAIRRDLPTGARVDDIWPSPSLGNLVSIIPCNFTDALVTVAPLIKDPSFEAESEWRLVSLNCLLLEKYRGGNIPYVALPLPDDGVTEVVVGPGPEQRCALDCAVALAKKHGRSFFVRLSNTAPIY